MLCVETHLKEEGALNTTQAGLLSSNVCMSVFNGAHTLLPFWKLATPQQETGNDHSGQEKQIKQKAARAHSRWTHPVFVIHYIAQHVIHVQNAAIPVLQPVDLDPVAGVLKDKAELPHLFNVQF